MVTIGDFVINERLGEGAFGVVYSGRCSKTGKQVAIKIEKEQDIPTSFAKHEASVLLSLKGCRGVPSLLGYGLFQEHRYIVTPLFDESLQDRVNRDGKLDGLNGLMIRKQIRDILKSIHKRGFIHRDIKPDNVMFSGKDIYLIDFGCATNYKTAERNHKSNNKSPHNRTPPKSNSYVGTYEFLGDMGKQGYICCEVDFEGLEKTMDACM